MWVLMKAYSTEAVSLGITWNMRAYRESRQTYQVHSSLQARQVAQWESLVRLAAQTSYQMRHE